VKEEEGDTIFREEKGQIKNITVYGASQTFPAFPSDNSSMKVLRRWRAVAWERVRGILTFLNAKKFIAWGKCCGL